MNLERIKGRLSAISEKLAQNNYEHIKLNDTIYKDLTISESEKSLDEGECSPYEGLFHDIDVILCGIERSLDVQEYQVVKTVNLVFNTKTPQ